jgi:excinuclease ABC subunit A
VWAVVAWPEGVAPVVSARGLDRRHTVLDALGGLSAMQKLFAAHGDLPARAFSFRSPAGRCETCGGSGQETVALDVLADLELPCPACEGRRYRPEVLAVRWPSSGDDVARWLDRPVDDLVPALEADGSKPARELLGACRRLGGLGLGGLSFGRALGSLSGGEQQRIVLAAMDPREEGGVVLLEQPDRGLHGADLPAVAERLRALGERHLVLVQGVRPELAALLA